MRCQRYLQVMVFLGVAWMIIFNERAKEFLESTDDKVYEIGKGERAKPQVE
ncbi:hypothetical protein [Cohnella luojiensis]|uniref:hypothetical protein n=1 Tax=Cohnella luojiensis TaxID=652876 RepID=UPI001431AD52|nr:hypothetical protein [Cohnella luojiensis]